MATWACKPHNHVSKTVFQRLDSTLAKELERGFLQAVGSPCKPPEACKIPKGVSLLGKQGIEVGLGHGLYYDPDTIVIPGPPPLYKGAPGAEKIKLQALEY